MKIRVRAQFSLFFFVMLIFIQLLFAPKFVLKAYGQTAAANTSSVQILSQPWYLSAVNGSSEKYQSVDKNVLNGMSMMEITYDLHGLCAIGGDASAIIFDQNGWKYISLNRYGKNCLNGEQTVTLPLSDFSNLNTAIPLTGSVHTRFWYNLPFNVDIKSITLIKNTPQPPPAPSAPPVTPTPSQSVTPTPTIIPALTLTPSVQPTATPTALPTPTPTASPSPTMIPTPTPTPIAAPSTTPELTVTPTPVPIPWDIRSVDVMKVTKDTVCSQADTQTINKILDEAVAINANYVAISTPYDNPACGNAVNYGQIWADAIHARGLHIWHRHMPLAQEGIYNTAKNNQDDFFDLIASYIQNNPDMFASGDIFTPIPEPQNGGISGITYCGGGICQYANQAEFNKWIKDSMLVSELSFAKINKTGIKIGYFGFDAFVTWGQNNADWNGILYDSTIKRMGNEIAIDHYPETIGTDMGHDLDILHSKYPDADIIISEWGTVTGGNTQAQVNTSMGEAKARSFIKGFNYWQFGPNNTNESLIDNSFNPKAQFNTVKTYFNDTIPTPTQISPQPSLEPTDQPTPTPATQSADMTPTPF